MGQTVPQPDDHECEPGHMCPEGSGKQIPCPSGFYQDEAKAGVCKVREWSATYHFILNFIILPFSRIIEQ